MTDNQLYYQLPPFVIEPVFCDIVYTYTVKDLNGDGLVCLDCFDPVTQTFTFYYDQDLFISGDTFADYVVEVTGSAGTSSPIS